MDMASERLGSGAAMPEEPATGAREPDAAVAAAVAARAALAAPVAARAAAATPERGIGGLAELAQRPTVESAIAAVREFLDMEMAFTSQFSEECQVLRVICGDRESFYASEGVAVPLEYTYCQRVLDGRLPNIIPDTNTDDRAAELPGTTVLGIGSFVSVPLRFSDGRLYGTMCAASHEARGDLGQRELLFLQVFARIVSDILEREELQRAEADARVRLASAGALIAAVDARDHYTGEHSSAVVGHAVAIARRLGLTEEEVAEVQQVALLHDIGKIAVPDAILHKPGRLDEDEWEIMRRHPVTGADLIVSVPGLRHLARAIRAEHERWDGGGYPDGLAGERIPMASRIAFVCDAYHAMTSDRPYRRAMPEEDARAELRAGSGSQFCPAVVAALLDLLEDAPPDSVDEQGTR
jgi:HD-GYP domain-containing protein (c-di-GMP phosphodiesterase class II)